MKFSHCVLRTSCGGHFRHSSKSNHSSHDARIRHVIFCSFGDLVELRRYVSFLSGIMFEMTLFPLATFVKGLTVTKVSKMVAKHK